ncbi:NUDIX domain-containing protein [Halobacterium litoreum]|uniref:NUDIX domain-containing protein n=1 Tax=Halobacterium litoreum TaxID=2039234 RepID=A0ABD5NIF3_9EURY|nr:NUDIX domain-containing protein [Halobacterium litoreum]UHH12236.1 NUDIX domain-containing protein [Halobacterium litoreum]
MPSPVSEGRDVRVGVVAAVERDGEVLFERRTADEEDGRLWGLLAGGKTAGESTVEAAKREVREETGLDFHPERVVALFDHDSHYGSGTAWTVVGLAGPADGDPAIDREPEKRDRLDWFPIDDPPAPLHPTTELFLDADDADGLHPGLER